MQLILVDGPNGIDSASSIGEYRDCGKRAIEQLWSTRLALD
jgi:hypothetical protein